MRLEIDVVAIAVSCFAACYWVIRKVGKLESEIDTQKKQITSLEEKQKEDHSAIVLSTSEKEKALWDQVNAIQSTTQATLLNISSQLGELRGEIRGMFGTKK